MAALALSDVAWHGNRGPTHLGRQTIDLVFGKSSGASVDIQRQCFCLLPCDQVSITLCHERTSPNQYLALHIHAVIVVTAYLFGFPAICNLPPASSRAGSVRIETTPCPPAPSPSTKRRCSCACSNRCASRRSRART